MSIIIRFLIWLWAAPFVAHFLEMTWAEVLQAFLNLIGYIIPDCLHNAIRYFECISFLVGSWSEHFPTTNLRLFWV